MLTGSHRAPRSCTNKNVASRGCIGGNFQFLVMTSPNATCITRSRGTLSVKSPMHKIREPAGSETTGTLRMSYIPWANLASSLDPKMAHFLLVLPMSVNVGSQLLQCLRKFFAYLYCMRQAPAILQTAQCNIKHGGRQAIRANAALGMPQKCRSLRHLFQCNAPTFQGHADGRMTSETFYKVFDNIAEKPCGSILGSF